MELEGKTVLITGCTGFLGSHLARSLVRQKRLRVRGLVQNRFLEIEKIKDLPVELMYGDMTSFKAMIKTTRGCDVVVHCAVGNPSENVIGTKNVIGAAWKNGIKKFIYISSSAVFGYSPSSFATEKDKLDNQNNWGNYVTAYGYSKLLSERIAFAYYDSYDFPIVVLRPTNIYGPDSFHWTNKPLVMLQEGCYVLVDGGLTPSNIVHVDDVVKAIELAILEDDAVGHAMTISNNEVVNWRKLFAGYSLMFSNPPPLLDIDKESLTNIRSRQQFEFLKKNILNPKRFFSIFTKFAESSQLINMLAFLGNKFSVKTNFYNIVSKTIGRTNLQKMVMQAIRREGYALEQQEPSLSELSIPKIPELWLEKTFTLPFHFPIDKANRILGFKPTISFDEGMEKIHKWLLEYVSRSGFESSRRIFGSSVPAFAPLVSSRPH